MFAYLHLTVLLGLLWLIAPAFAAKQTVSQLLAEIDDMWRSQSSHAITTMQVKTAHYTRSMRMEG